MTDEARVLKKKNWRLELGPMALSQAQNEFFCHFLEFTYLVFFEIAHDDSLRQCLTSSKEKNPHKKKIGDPDLGQTGQNWAQN